MDCVSATLPFPLASATYSTLAVRDYESTRASKPVDDWTRWMHGLVWFVVLMNSDLC